MTNKISIADVLKETCAVISKDKKPIFEMAGVTLVLSLFSLLAANGASKLSSGGLSEILFLFFWLVMHMMIWAVTTIALSRYVLLDEPIRKDFITKRWNFRHTRWVVFSIYFSFMQAFVLILWAIPIGLLASLLKHNDIVIIVLGVCFMVPILVYFSARFILFPQAIAIDNLENPLKHSWEKTKGNVAPLAVLIALIYLPTILISFGEPTLINLSCSEIVSFPFTFFGCIAFAVAYKKITA